MVCQKGIFWEIPKSRKNGRKINKFPHCTLQARVPKDWFQANIIVVVNFIFEAFLDTRRFVAFNDPKTERQVKKKVNAKNV